MGETLADGLAGNLEPGAVTFELVRDHVAAVVHASEPEIEEAIRFLARAHGIVAEGAGAAAVAAVMRGRVRARRRAAGRPRDGPQHRAAAAGGGAVRGVAANVARWLRDVRRPVRARRSLETCPA